MVKAGRENFGTTGHVLLAAYSAALTAVLLCSAPFWLRGMRRGGKYREGWRERLGRIPGGRLRAPAAGETVVWVHAVSVGEVLAAAPLVLQLREEVPGARVFVSTTTRTGQAIARARFGADSVFYFPLDFAFAMRRWLRFLAPRVCVLIESEFWPRMLFEAAQAGLPVAVVNARISPRSWPRYRRLRRLWQPLLRTLAAAQAQTEEDAERLRLLGAQHAKKGGNLKYDVQPGNPTPLLAMLRGALPAQTPVLVCGSTLEGEEDFLLQNLPAEPVLLLAPRHPERFDEAAALLARGSRPWARLSTWRLAPVPIEAGTVLLLDSVGELAAFYVLATVAIVGGGFLHAGGHNPLEPAALGKPVVIGPGYANFVGIVATLRDAHAIAIAELPELRATVQRLLSVREEAAAMAARAELVCLMHRGATKRAIAALTPLLRASR